MTSKEKTLKRLEHQKRINAEEKLKYGRISFISKLETEYLKEVLKDLEVLEILKKTFKSNSIYMITLKHSLESERINEEDYNKIKEWLEGE